MYIAPACLSGHVSITPGPVVHKTVGRRRETGPACGLRQLNQTGGLQVMGEKGQRAGAGGRWAEGERSAVAVLGRAGRERGARVNSWFWTKREREWERRRGLLGMIESLSLSPMLSHICITDLSHD